MDTIHLGVETVIGTGDPFDKIFLIPLIIDWKIPKNCLFALIGQECENGVSRIYVLREPVEGHKHLAICEEHHRELKIQETKEEAI